MKKLIAVLTVLVLALSVCSLSLAEDDRLAAIKEAGVITVCAEPYFPPMEFIDPMKLGAEQFVGVDVELAKYVADKIGVKLEYVPLEFSAVLTGIAEGKYDLAISALAWSKTRAESMNLSIGYYTSLTGGDDYGFFCRIEDKDKYNTIEAVQQAVVVTQSGSVQEGYYDEFVKTCKEFKRTSSMTDAYLAVKEGKADVCVCSIDAANLWAEANGNVTTTTDFRFPSDESKGGTRVAAAPEGTDSLMEIVNQCITELTEQGKFLEWNDTYKEYAKSLGLDF